MKKNIFKNNSKKMEKKALGKWNQFLAVLKKNKDMKPKESTALISKQQPIKVVTEQGDIAEVITKPQFSKQVMDNSVNDGDLNQIFTVEYKKAVSYEEYVPSDEQEVPVEKEISGMKPVDRTKLFSPIRNMAHITMDSGGELYAGIYVDEKDYRNIKYIQKYRNGTLSSPMYIRQATIMMANEYNKLKTEDINKGFIKIIGADYQNALNEYCSKYQGTVMEDMLSINDILNTFCKLLGQLPVCSDMSEEIPDDEFYWYLISQIENNCIQVASRNYKAYYPLSEEEITELARLVNMRKIDLLKKLRQMGLLYLTPSSRGYQTNVRIKGFCDGKMTEWMYCIYKLPFLMGDKEEDRSKLLNLL